MTSFLWVSICVCFCQISQANHKIKTSGVTVARAVHDSFGGKQKKTFLYKRVTWTDNDEERERDKKWTDEQRKDLTRDWFWNTGIWMKAVATMQRQGLLGRGQRYIIHAATYKVARWCSLKKGYSWEGEREERIKKGEREKTPFP